MAPKEYLLQERCRLNLTRKAIELLEGEEFIDLTQNQGICFKFAIKRHNDKILNALLEHYNKTKLPEDLVDTHDYKMSLVWLKSTLEEAVKTYDITPNIKQILKPYNLHYIVEEEDSTDEEQNLDGFEDNNFQEELDISLIGDPSPKNQEISGI